MQRLIRPAQDAHTEATKHYHTYLGKGSEPKKPKGGCWGCGDIFASLDHTHYCGECRKKFPTKEQVSPLVKEAEQIMETGTRM